MAREHSVIIIPGLGDRYLSTKLSTVDWKNRLDLNPYIHLAPWKDDEEFHFKLKRLTDLIDYLVSQGSVSLVGISAGWSLVVNAYSQRREDITRLVNVCGRGSAGKNVRPNLTYSAKKSPAFKQSVLAAEKVLPTLSDSDLRKIMTIRGLYDEAVPLSTIPILGAKNIQIPSLGHVPTITIAMTIARGPMVKFLQSE
ncbi:MAG: hypothetical protein Q7S88_01045 [Candidatus Daviesbacteria bacterium]|nr:hypothetical protein [Candidatus Daviesbacteria bacterium]